MLKALTLICTSNFHGGRHIGTHPGVVLAWRVPHTLNPYTPSPRNPQLHKRVAAYGFRVLGVLSQATFPGSGLGVSMSGLFFLLLGFENPGVCCRGSDNTNCSWIIIKKFRTACIASIVTYKPKGKSLLVTQASIMLERVKSINLTPPKLVRCRALTLGGTFVEDWRIFLNMPQHVRRRLGTGAREKILDACSTTNYIPESLGNFKKDTGYSQHGP